MKNSIKSIFLAAKAFDQQKLGFLLPLFFLLLLSLVLVVFVKNLMPLAPFVYSLF